jgi:hypothetical protein
VAGGAQGQGPPHTAWQHKGRCSRHPRTRAGWQQKNVRFDAAAPRRRLRIGGGVALRRGAATSDEGSQAAPQEGQEGARCHGSRATSRGGEAAGRDLAAEECSASLPSIGQAERSKRAVEREDSRAGSPPSGQRPRESRGPASERDTRGAAGASEQQERASPAGSRQAARVPCCAPTTRWWP